MKKITVLIPCYNEEKGVDYVLKYMPLERLKRYGFETELIVVDNNSTDNTVHIARQRGAKVIHEQKKGKGNALIRGFKAINPQSQFVVMMDGDSTYKPLEIPRLIEPLETNFCDIVAGSRLGGKILDGSLNRFNRAGNWFFTFLVRNFYKANITDTLTGFFSFKKEVIDELLPYLVSIDFAIEMEIVTKAARMGFVINSVPITYGRRAGHSKLDGFDDGYKIFRMFLRNLYWKPSKRKFPNV